MSSETKMKWATSIVGFSESDQMAKRGAELAARIYEQNISPTRTDTQKWGTIGASLETRKERFGVGDVLNENRRVERD